MKWFLKPCALTFMDRPHILLCLGQYFSLYPLAACVRPVCLLSSSLPPGLRQLSLPMRRLLTSLVAASPSDSEPSLHFPQLPKVTQKVTRGTVSRTQLLRQVGLIFLTLLLPEVVFPLIVIPFDIK